MNWKWHFINLLTNGTFYVKDNLIPNALFRLTETAQLFSIDITELCNDENVPSLDEHSQDNVNIGVRKVEDKSYKFPRKSSFDQSTDIYVETNFNTIENTQMDNATQMKEIVVVGTKRKRTSVSKINDGKYQCQQCDYESSESRYLRHHVEAKHEGARYPCEQCEYKATLKGHLKQHVASIHQGVRYPCDQCDYRATRNTHLKTHKKVKHEC